MRSFRFLCLCIQKKKDDSAQSVAETKKKLQFCLKVEFELEIKIEFFIYNKTLLI